MNRRHLLVAVSAFVLLSTSIARAEPAEDIAHWLGEQGYSDIAVTRTLLGRVRILATFGGAQRELILNPRTGEILRDVWIGGDGTVHPIASSVPGTGDSGSSGGTGESSPGEDDEPDDGSDDGDQSSGESGDSGSGDGEDGGGGDDGDDD